MRKTLMELVVYPILLVNIAIGFMMFGSTHMLVLVLISRWNQDGVFVEAQLGPFYAIQQSISIVSVILMAIIALMLFPFLERYYTKAVQQKSLIQRVAYILGMQFIYLGIVQTITRSIVEALPDIDLFLTWLIGLVLMIVSNRMMIRHKIMLGQTDETSKQHST